MVSNGVFRVYLWYKNTPFWPIVLFAIWPASEIETWCLALKPLCVEGLLKKMESDGGGGFGIFINLKVTSFMDSSLWEGMSIICD